MIPWWSTDFGEPEIANVAEAINNRCISQGKVTRQFEERLAEVLGVPYVVCTTSGTTALTMAILACGIHRGVDIWLPNRTWIASAHAAIMAGLTVRLADVTTGAPLLDPENVPEDAIVAMPVNLNGRLANIDDLGASWIIEDSCQSFPNPPRAEIACYSLSTAKIIATGQGGFCATRDEGLYKEMKALRTHDVEDAMVPQVLEWKRFGYNFRFTDIQAAIGLAQLERLPARLDAIHAIHAEYRSQGIDVCETQTPLYNELCHVEPERLRAHLQAHGIEARPFYPSLHTAAYLRPYNKTQYFDYEFPNSAKWAQGVILPSGPCQKLEDIRRVCDAVAAFR